MYCQAAMGLYEKQNKIRTMIPKKSHLPKVTPTWVEQTITYILNNSRDALHSELVKMLSFFVYREELIEYNVHGTFLY